MGGAWEMGFPRRLWRARCNWERLTNSGGGGVGGGKSWEWTLEGSCWTPSSLKRGFVGVDIFLGEDAVRRWLEYSDCW